jgi:hypothetical protein
MAATGASDSTVMTFPEACQLGNEANASVSRRGRVPSGVRSDTLGKCKMRRSFSFWSLPRAVKAVSGNVAITSTSRLANAANSARERTCSARSARTSRPEAQILWETRARHLSLAQGASSPRSLTYCVQPQCSITALASDGCRPLCARPSPHCPRSSGRRDWQCSRRLWRPVSLAPTAPVFPNPWRPIRCSSLHW